MKKLKGFQPVTEPVTRSPLVMADYMISLLDSGPQSRRYVEVGTRQGDIFACVKEFAAKESVAIEHKASYCKALEGRGLRHICKSYANLTTVETFPEAEVYYFWSYPFQLEHFLRHVVNIESLRPRKGRGALAVLNFDMTYHEDISLRSTFAARYGDYHSEKVFFDEGDRDREYGLHWPVVVELGGLVERVAKKGWDKEWIVPPKDDPEL